MCVYITDVDSIHLHTTHILLSSLPVGGYIFTEGSMNESGGDNISENAAKVRKELM
jgi:hypothetical protein